MLNTLADAGVHSELVPILGKSHFQSDDHDICSGFVPL